MKESILIVEDQFVEADYLRQMLVQAKYPVIGIARSVVQAEELMKRTRPDFVLLDIFLKGKQTGIDLAKKLAEENIPFVYLSANSSEDVLHAAKATQPFGFIVKPFREKDLLVTLEIAKYRHEHSQETRHRKEKELIQKLRRIPDEAYSLEEELLQVGKAIQTLIPFDYLTVAIEKAGQAELDWMSYLRIGFDEYQRIGVNELQVITGRSLQEIAHLQESENEFPAVIDAVRFRQLCSKPGWWKLVADAFQVQSQLNFQMGSNNGGRFLFCLYSRRKDVYTAEHIELFKRVRDVSTFGADKLLHKKSTHNVNTGGTAGLVVIPGNYQSPEGFEGLVGKSHLLLNIFDHVSQVAATSTSVLLLGESGTGKGKIADCIHHLSLRKGQPFIKVNCAALPSTLIESELFGHERGAFTGAMERRIGKFEKAHKGTIFLDEIGEMPIELQSKLLKVLQEKEIERIGGQDVIKVDVRIIAATNKNLEKEVAEGRFRLDLYYRLNVFPITLPSLRDRKEDIPALAYFFMNYYNNKSGKKITGISENVLKKLMAYHWPGNIRELEHLIERHVLLSKGTIIEDIQLPVMTPDAATVTDESRMKTIHENERDYIISVLRKCNGKVWGAGAAAEILNLPPSTLKSRMIKLGIRADLVK